MAIVLPRRKKHADIFAPSKAIQDAKAKIGPAFFDVTLLECSRNAVELTKLVHQWEELDKEKVKILKDISHEQELLIRSLKKHNPDGTEGKTVDSLTKSTSTPGFRFKSNGDIKRPTKSMASLHFSELEDEDEIFEETTNGFPEMHKAANERMRSKSAVVKNRNDYECVDYENEINELENVIREIYTDLVKNKVSLTNNTIGGGNVKTFLRAHTNEYIPMLDTTKTDMNVYAHPNDRFAFKPGSSSTRDTYLHKHKIKTPSHRSCIGCQIRLRPEIDELAKLKKTHSDSLSKRRWSYVPQGKYVQSSTVLHATPSLTERKSTHSLSSKTSSKTLNNKAKSMVQFKSTEKVAPPRGAVSLAVPNTIPRPKSSVIDGLGNGQRMRPKSGMRPKSCLSVNTNKSGFESDLSTSRSINVLGWKSGIDMDSDKTSLDRSIGSSLSCRSARASSARINAHFIDHDSRLNLLKAIQAEEEKNCEKKIQEFLHKIDSSK